MAKNKKRKEEKKGNSEYTMTIYGLVFVILSIMAFGAGKPLGIVGKFMRGFAVFLFGTLEGVFILGVFILGIYLLLKRKLPAFWSSKFVGFLIFLIGVLVFSHLPYIEENSGNAGKIFQLTLDDIMGVIDQIRYGASFSTTGSGIIGCGFAILFSILFDYTGTKIVSILLMVTGACLFTGFSILDMIRSGVEKTKNVIPKLKKASEENREEKEPEKEEKKVIINDNTGSKEEVKEKMVVSSLEELKQKTEAKPEEPLPEEKKEVIINTSDNENQQIEQSNLNYQLPSLSLLNPPKKEKVGVSQETIERNIGLLEKVLRDFGINGKVVEVNTGPSVTQYEMELQTGTKLSKLLGINREISLALAKKDVRIQAPIPGKSTVGIEIANDTTSPVSLREILENAPSSKANSKLLVALGKNIMGKSIFAEIDKTPHLLVAGATGSGKSVCINCIIASILMRTKPDEVKLMMVDPKKVELSMYNGIPHLMMPVVTDPKKASIALQKIVSEMESRYDVFSDHNVKNIGAYNEWVEKENKNRVDTDRIKKMHYIVVIVDELADLMLVASKEVEDSIMRITQMARAAGIHLIVATQRPSTDVITGVVKANIPSRISFAVSSSIDSRTILDMTGAEKLLGKGDMLFLPMGENAPQRIQGAYVSDEELERIVEHTVSQQKAQYDERFMNLTEAAKDQGNAGGEKEMINEEYDDPLYDEIVEFVITTGKASASLLQRRFKLGYNRAARIIDLLEERGIIGPQNGSKPREVLVKLDEEEQDME